MRDRITTIISTTKGCAKALSPPSTKFSYTIVSIATIALLTLTGCTPKPTDTTQDWKPPIYPLQEYTIQIGDLLDIMFTYG